MDILRQAVKALSKEEVRTFKLWLKSSYKNTARKDVALFDYIRKSGDCYREDFIHRKLYGKHHKNSFYRLKNRLLENVASHLSLLHADKHTVNKLFWFLSLHQIFIAKNKPRLALYFLHKAEREAVREENYELLDFIYAAYVKLSTDVPEIDPEVYIQKQNENARLLFRLRQSDQAIAAVNHRLKLTQNFARKDVGLLKLLDNTIREFAKDESLSRSRTFQTRMYRAVSQSLLQNHNYAELERYLLATYKNFSQNNWFDRSNHEIKIQMLIYLVNALFKNGKYHESLDYAETLGDALNAYGGIFYDKYFFYYYNALVFNYAQIDLKRGLKALDELEQELRGHRNSYYEFFLYLNRANLLFYQRQPDAAIRYLMRLYANEYFKKADESLKLKISVAECIMQYECGDADTVIKRVEQVRKKFNGLLAGKAYIREVKVLQFLDIFAQNLAGHNGRISLKLVRDIERFLNHSNDNTAEDSEIIRYNTWLREKLLALQTGKK
ncbi:MAG: hypothetical protein NZM35_03910 [Chitinophagales bacterium]|nr:hypothetical protein [Chitinophagales bacterium]MDW8418742.1 hypothetical protein [Chitinophagales bacterium]